MPPHPPPRPPEDLIPQTLERYTLHHGEALVWLASLPSGSVDATITDPPYSSGGFTRGDRSRATSTKYCATDSENGSRTLLDFTGDNRDQRSWMRWSMLWLQECWRVTRNGGAVAVWTDWRQLPATTDALQHAGWVWRGISQWHKPTARPQTGRPRADCEYLVWGSKGGMPLDRDAPILPGTLIHHQRKDDRHHQVGKPLEVMRWAVQLCERGGLILDPFMGSGTTGVAALLEGFRFQGCELMEGYFERSRLRIAAASRGRILKAGNVEAPPPGQAGLFSEAS